MIQPLLGTVNRTAQFMLEAVNNPRDIGAVVPSSPNLALAMARWLPWEPGAKVLELGAGTGAVTKMLLKQGLAAERLLAVEKSPKLAAMLRKQFPLVRVVEGDAFDLGRLVAEHDPDPEPYALVISSLPLLNFPQHEGMELAALIRDVLRPGGLLVQYSYNLVKGREERLYCFRRVASEIVLVNVPPAKVTVYRR
jgi:phosphatidylethanolamine/phosphatidyl-N-methylethanolamine N-methyltransferase